MAGRRQHYIPRLLQRGFLHDPSDEVERTWLHRRDAKARLVSIRDVGVKDSFYSRKSKSGTQTLDDVITEIEADLAIQVDALRATPAGSPIDAEEAAGIVVHLVMRTAYLRRAFAASATRMINELQSTFADPVRLGSMIGVDRPTVAPVVSTAIREEATTRVPPGIPSDLFERLLAFEIRELGTLLVENAVYEATPLFSNIISVVEGKIRDAHNSALAKLQEKSALVDVLSAFTWTVEFDTDLILSDAVALAREKDSAFMPLLFTKITDVQVVVMPLASNRILVGRSIQTAPIDLETFNKDAAASSECFFIAAKPFEDGELNALVGSALTNEIDASILVALRKTAEVTPIAGMAMGEIEPTNTALRTSRFTVHLADFGDKNLVSEFARVLEGVVGAIDGALPLSALDGFTIAHDLRSALSNLDHDKPDYPLITFGEFGYCSILAKNVSVMRDGALREHVVVAAGLAEMWLSQDAEVRAAGLYPVVKMLAEIAHPTLYGRAGEASFPVDSLARDLHAAVARAPTAYWSARQAAFVAPNYGQTHARLVIESLDFAEREISAQRTRMSESTDIESATTRAFQCISAVIQHAADWLGHRDGLGQDQCFSGDDLPEQLYCRGLHKWIELFGRDLGACYGSEDSLNLDFIRSLSPHVERLFWSMGIYCWVEDKEVRCIVTDQRFVPPEFPGSR